MHGAGPGSFEPVGVPFVGGSITSPGAQEAQEHGNKKNPLRKLFIADRPDGTMEPTMNLLQLHGVRSALAYAESGDLAKKHAVSNPELSPHLGFVDMGGHGHDVVSVDASQIVTDFVRIPRPIKRAATPDGGPLRYRVRCGAPASAPNATALTNGIPRLSAKERIPKALPSRS